MLNDPSPAPRTYLGVTISSTFSDLAEHRQALIACIEAQGLKPVAMENDGAKADVDVLQSSLDMVRDGAAYVGVISHKYGQVPDCGERNPAGLSLTEIEFNEAQRLGRPILLFIMGDDYAVPPRDHEVHPEKRAKLDRFRKRARLTPESGLHRVYAEFNSLDEFRDKAAPSIATLRPILDRPTRPRPGSAATGDEEGSTTPAPAFHLPKAPAFHAVTPYIGSHSFQGRQAQLQMLSEWAMPKDPNPLLVFEAIGGSGKSMLTWEWATRHAVAARPDWAGRFWYSFYERGAIMTDFCQRALSYMTGRPQAAFQSRKVPELGELLRYELKRSPWLLVLDGLERVLVAYHRIEASAVPDEQADRRDATSQRDPCAAIHPEDDTLLRQLAIAGPSKLLLTSRLTPRALVNASLQPIPGVRREFLPGLQPEDAEAMLRASGVRGSSTAMRRYLQLHCNCHPLVSGVLAGLVHDYLPDRGNFDAWAADPEYGGRLDLSGLNLVQKRNHILDTALHALQPASRKLLAALALLPAAADHATIGALNPHLPPAPEPVDEPVDPSTGWQRMLLSKEEQQQAQDRYRQDIRRRKAYEQAEAAREHAPEALEASKKLSETIRDLEERGLLQYDRKARRHDLHPVVRGVAAELLRDRDTEKVALSLVDHFSQRPEDPYEQAQTLEDVRVGMQVVHVLQRIEDFSKAADAYVGDLSNALLINLEAYAETLALLRPFFRKGWAVLPKEIDAISASYLATDAAIALRACGQRKESLDVMVAALRADMERGHLEYVRNDLCNLAEALPDGCLSGKARCHELAIEVASLGADREAWFMAQLYRCRGLSVMGDWAAVEALWRELDHLGRDWSRAACRPGTVEYGRALMRFWQGTLAEAELDRVERLAQAHHDRQLRRELRRLRGELYMQQARWPEAAENLQEAVHMARAIGLVDGRAETLLALAQHRLGRLTSPHAELLRLAQGAKPFRRGLAELAWAIGEEDEALAHGRMAYREAWAEGEPYVVRYELIQARALLDRLNAPLPSLPAYDPAARAPLPWEDEVHRAMERWRATR